MIEGNYDESTFVPDYGPYEEEIPTDKQRIRASAMRHSKSKPCPCCPGRFTNVRKHALRIHVPWYVAATTACWCCKVQFAQTCLLEGHIKEFHKSDSEGQFRFTEEIHGLIWVEYMNGLFDIIRNKLECKSLKDLCKLADEKVNFMKDSEPVYQAVDIKLLKLFNNINSLCFCRE